jgi:hypothetical protein
MARERRARRKCPSRDLVRWPSPKTYVETSLVSYLTSRPSEDLVCAAHQQVTREWWAGRKAFDLYASQFVLDEAAKGGAEAAARRLVVLEDIPLLEVTEEATALAAKILSGGGLPSQARVDALHVAVATVHGMDYLLSWNCKHIANATLRSRIEGVCRLAGFEPPVICTPLKLAEE